MAVMSSSRNRSDLHVDNDVFNDGFWTARYFKGRRRTGQPTGGRLWRRQLRAAEKSRTRQQIETDRRDND